MSGADFATTQWTLVWNAAVEDSRHGRPALTEVIRRYWEPLYSFARRRGLSSEDAEDATQEFLQRIIQGDLLHKVDPARGKFRAFLLTAWKRFLIDEYRKQSSARRGGVLQTLPLDIASSERRLQHFQSREADPDHAFYVSWANSLLDEVRGRLRVNYAGRERNEVFEMLMPRLTEQLSAEDYRSLAFELRLSPSAIKVALHRLRQRFGQTLRDVVLETVDDPADVESELGELLSVLTHGSH